MLLIAGGSCVQAQDFSWKNIQFGGFVSQGYLVNSGHNDYLGNTSDGTFDYREYAANASWTAGKWRVGAQAFGQKLGVYGDDKIKLDWATIDYQPAQWFGVRAGRVKMPRGLYNEALDLDSVRPFVLLPQGIYDARLRDFNASFDGGMLYGNVPLGRLGSVDYRAFYGNIPMSTKSGANDYFNNDVPYPNVAIGMDSVRGGSLFWNPALSGLRFGYSYSAFQNFNADRLVSFPATEWYPAMSFVMYKEATNYERHLLSAEYTHGAWTFAAELAKERAHYNIGMREYPEFVSVYGVDNLSAYVSAARRINRWLELGTYYGYSIEQQPVVTLGGLEVPDLIQDDVALSARFDLSEHLLFKLEGHYLHGAGKIFDTPTHPQPFALRDTSWSMLAAKVTYTF